MGHWILLAWFWTSAIAADSAHPTLKVNQGRHLTEACAPLLQLFPAKAKIVLGACHVGLNSSSPGACKSVTKCMQEGLDFISADKNSNLVQFGLDYCLTNFREDFMNRESCFWHIANDHPKTNQMEKDQAEELKKIVENCSKQFTVFLVGTDYRKSTLCIGEAFRTIASR